MRNPVGVGGAVVIVVFVIVVGPVVAVAVAGVIGAPVLVVAHAAHLAHVWHSVRFRVATEVAVGPGGRESCWHTAVKRECEMEVDSNFPKAGGWKKRSLSGRRCTWSRHHGCGHDDCAGNRSYSLKELWARVKAWRLNRKSRCGSIGGWAESRWEMIYSWMFWSAEMEMWKRVGEEVLLTPGIPHSRSEEIHDDLMRSCRP